MANLRADNLTGTGGRNAIDGSLSFDGNFDGLGIPSIALGSGDWTIEFWFYMTKTASNNQHIYDGRGTGSASSAYPIIRIDTNEKLSYYTTGAGRITGNTTIQVGSWNHVAFVKNSGTLTAYLNGVSEGTYSDSNTYIAPSNSVGRIGTDDNGTSYYFYGYLSNFRIVKGTAVYTAAFTPPTEKLTVVDDTVLLCCQDSDDATQEALGKTITGYGSRGGDKTEGNLLTNTLDWSGAASSYSTTMPDNWTAGNGAQVQYETGGTSGGGANRMLRLRNDGSNSYISQSIPTVIGQRYQIDLWYEAQNSSLAVKWSAGTSAGSDDMGSTQWNVGSDGTQATKTGSFAASATTTYFNFQIISGTNDASVFVDDIQVKAFNPKAPKVLPSVGVDEGVVFDGDTKVNTQNYMYFPTGDTSQRSRGRGILFGGGSPGRTNRIDYIDIPSGGNSIDFGNLACGNVWGSGAGASSTRGVFWGGENQYTKLDYVTIATTGNATSFGTSSNNSNQGTCMSSETRAVFVVTGGNIMEYVTIASTGNTTDFGDHNDGALTAAAGLASPTRGIVSGGYGPSPYPQSNTIQYITIATTGNASDFGDLTFGHSGHFGVSSTTRGVFAKGYTFPSPATTYYNTIEYITIASTGNATDFGDATNSVTQGYSHASHTRGVFAAGTAAADINTIDYITIATTGNAKDFGDTHSATRGGSGTSDCHGGIS